jgi:hypothetical protein
MVSLLATWRPLARLTRWGQAPSSAWLGDVAWVRRLHAIGEGTPDLGYRQPQNLIFENYVKFSKDFELEYFFKKLLKSHLLK